MWKEGAIRVGNSIFKFWVKHYDEGSCYGIDEGRISKVTLKRNGQTVCNYDRGWDVLPVDTDTETALEILKKEYNK